MCAEACIKALEQIESEEQIAGRLSDSGAKTVVGQEISEAWQ